jgi:hypothetical protein
MSPDHRAFFNACLKAHDLPNLVLVGPPGCGKTTIAGVLEEHIAQASETMNAGIERGVDVVRQKVAQRLMVGGGFNRFMHPDRKLFILRIEEADGLTADALRGLRDLMEEYAEDSRFIFTTNAPLPDAAILDRAHVVNLDTSHIPIQEKARILRRVLDAEGLHAEQTVLEDYAMAARTMRELLTVAEWSFRQHGKLIARCVGPSEQASAPETDAVWPVPVNGAALLDAFRARLLRHVALPEGGEDAVVLWVLFAHAHDSFEFSPLLTAVSPVKRSGKTTLLSFLGLVTPRPLFVSSVTAAAVYRAVEELRPTLLCDEADGWMALGREVRTILNSGHRRGAAWVIRSAGKDGVERLSTWAPKALAMIRKNRADLPSTLADRSILLEMRRRATEALEPLRLDRPDAEWTELRMMAARWVQDHATVLSAWDPLVPDGMTDRAADNWRPLFAVADLASEEWSARARVAARLLSGFVDEDDELGVLLLKDLRALRDREGGDRIATDAILGYLGAMEERPWRGWISHMRLANLLRAFGVRPCTLWSCATRRAIRGYRWAHLNEAFSRYLGVTV